MSRKRGRRTPEFWREKWGGDLPPAKQMVELVLTCRGCGTGKEIFRLKRSTHPGYDDGTPEHHGLPSGVLLQLSREESNGVAHKLFITCQRGHDIQLRTAPLVEQLNQMHAETSPHHRRVDTLTV